MAFTRSLGQLLGGTVEHREARLTRRSAMASYRCAAESHATVNIEWVEVLARRTSDVAAVKAMRLCLPMTKESNVYL